MQRSTFLKNILPLAFALACLCAHRAAAQIPDGCTAPDFTLTDLNGNSHTLYTYLNQGKSVVLAFGKTGCASSWEYHQSGALQTLHAQRGPSGTLSQDLQVLFIESDPATPDAVLLTTPGDWTAGTAFPICNPATAAVPTSFGVTDAPVLLLVCPDKSVRRIPLAAANTLYTGFVADCSCRVPDFVAVVPASATSVNFVLDKPRGATKYQVQYKATSASVWKTKSVTPNYGSITSLSASETYEVKARAYCGGTWTAYTSPITFTTAGAACGQSNPSGHFVPLTTTTTRLFWQYGTGATKYSIRYRRTGVTNWTVKTSTPAAISAGGLLAGNRYEWQVRSFCGGVWSDWSASNFFHVQCAPPTLAPPADDRDWAETPADAPSLSLAPNPANDRLFIELENAEAAHLQLLDFAGRIVLTNTADTFSAEIDLTRLPAGTYFIRLEITDGAVLTERFVKF